MRHPAPSRHDHERFCQIDGWVRVRDAQGRSGTHHATYELTLRDGRTLRTRISHPPDRTGYGAGLWTHILRDQLGVSETEFWACVRDGLRPERGQPGPPKASLPADVVHLLITRVRVDEDTVARMTREAAIDRLRRYWIEGS